MKMIIDWKDASEKPEKSGFYITITDAGHVAHIHYSKHHDAWNCHDWFTEDEAKETSFPIYVWAEVRLPRKEAE